jgi:hypothetical protein
MNEVLQADNGVRWKDAVMVYTKAFPQNLPGGTTYII